MSYFSYFPPFLPFLQFLPAHRLEGALPVGPQTLLMVHALHHSWVPGGGEVVEEEGVGMEEGVEEGEEEGYRRRR